MPNEPIAIIGMSCRFPEAENLVRYWRLLETGVDAVRTVPASRWDIEHFYDPEIDAPGKMITRYGAFLEHPEHFDAAFFGMLPEEAERVDPQQRLALEVSWEALEDACIAPDSLSGTETGVFMGVSHSDYERIIYKETEGIRAYDGPGAYHALTANRVSFALNLKGPSLVVDSACSSSLSAIHVACQHLALGECTLAIVGGVNLNLTPEETIGLTKARMMSPHGRCMTMDARADGYVRGEGAGVLILKRLIDAERAGDRIRAVIRGSAINHNGRSNGVTAPNGPAQQELLRRALLRAGVSAAELGYVELHGTGTTYGDPIEVGALKAVLAGTDGELAPCRLGTVKTNIGHLEAASGVAGVIKVVLAFEHGVIPRSLHFESLSPLIDLSGSRLSVAARSEAWPPGPRIAGVSAFGFGGANAHVILEHRAKTPVAAATERPELLLLSAKTEPALRELVQRFCGAVGSGEVGSLADMCHSALAGRAHFAHRAAFVAETLAELGEKLASFADRSEPLPLPLNNRRPRLGLWLEPASDFVTALESVFGGLAAARERWRESVELTPPSSLDAAETLAEHVDRLAITELWRGLGVEFALVVAGSAASTTRKPPLDLLVTLGGAPSGGKLEDVPRIVWDAGESAWSDTLRLLGRLYEAGVRFDFKAVAALSGGNKTSLPTYPFERGSHWVQPVVKSPLRREAPRRNGAPERRLEESQ